MKIAIIGYGLEGHSALQYWQKKGAEITVCDKDTNKEIPEGISKQLGPGYLDDLDRFDVIVRTVGMHPKIILEKNPNIKGKITTNLNVFFEASPTKNIIGVTGTKGKGTTCSLIVSMLEAAGKQVFLGGNFGVPALDFLPELTPDSWVVLELSSFMLYDIKHSPHVAICLMVEPEHLDWHGDKDDYVRSKANMFRHQSKQDVAIYFSQNDYSHKIASASPGKKIPYFDKPGAYVDDGSIVIDKKELCKTSELGLLGKHNWQNVCAAVTAAWQIMQNPDIARDILTTFTGLPNRLELVREINGVHFYNDSFASDPYATEAAIDAIPDKKVMIVGGYERMIPLDHFAQYVKQQSKDLRHVLLIGQSAERVADAFEKAGFKNFTVSTAKTMPEVVTQASKLAKEGDTVVLSPGFASYDMFKNFEVRGLEFKEAVAGL